MRDSALKPQALDRLRAFRQHRVGEELMRDSALKLHGFRRDEENLLSD